MVSDETTAAPLLAARNRMRRLTIGCHYRDLCAAARQAHRWQSSRTHGSGAGRQSLIPVTPTELDLEDVTVAMESTVSRRWRRPPVLMADEAVRLIESGDRVYLHFSAFPNRYCASVGGAGGGIVGVDHQEGW
jgi:hypothetical protein